MNEMMKNTTELENLCSHCLEIVGLEIEMSCKYIFRKIKPIKPSIKGSILCYKWNILKNNDHKDIKFYY